jgi:predicted RNase H-like nuclease (RuvC/YqgF family)
MSKSNYQNILEGNMVPGVTYPTELSNNLTSKRTSHKIAEQGRRNRINSALHIMASLLPDNGKSASGEDSDKKDNKQQNASNSKASVVEQAIVHMRHLESENGDLKREVQELRSQLEQLKSSS